MKIQASQLISKYKEVSKLNPEQKNTISDKIYDKKEDIDKNVSKTKQKENEVKADIYSYKSRQNKLNIYMDVSSSSNDNSYLSKETNINVEINIERKNNDLDNKVPYKKIDEYI